MYKVIEGEYQNGEIRIRRMPSISENTRVLILFRENAEEAGEKNDFAKNLRLDYSEDSIEKRLEKMDVLVDTRENYLKSVSMHMEYIKNNARSPFLASEPIEISYTSAETLDDIIGENGI